MIPYLFYTISFLLVGMLSFSGADHNALSVFIGFLYTFYSAYFIKKFVQEETNALKAVKTIGPLFHFLTFFYFVILDTGIWLMLFHSIVINFVVFVCTLFDKKLFPNKITQFLWLILALFYALFAHDWLLNYRKNLQFADLADFSKTNQIDEHIKVAEIENFNLNDFNFLDNLEDTIKIKSDKKFVVLEIWNDVIGSINAYQSFTQMHDFWQAQDNVAYYPVFDAIDKDRPIDRKKLFRHPKIKSPQNIRIALGISDSLKIEQLPAFLIYNSKGELIFRQDGYNPAERFSFQNKIKQALQ